jgi:histidinol-phosphate aminotransferase
MIQTLRLDANEGRPAALPSRDPGFLEPETARRYPDSRPLEAALARRLGLESSRLVVTAGGDDAIDRAVRALAPPGSVVLSTEPAFVEYEAAATRSRARFVAVRREPDGPLPLRAILEAIREHEPAIVIVASPDNPGGGTLELEDLERIAERGMPLLFDCAYSEFADDQDVYRAALGIPNCIRVGSFSKAWGLAGLRVGWAAGSPDNIAAIRGAGPPFAVASTSLSAALSALEEGGSELERNVARVRRERAALCALLVSLGAKSWPTQANFAAAEVRDPRGLAAFLAARGIRVRSWPGRAGCERLVRITCPVDRDEFGVLARALREGREYL